MKMKMMVAVAAVAVAAMCAAQGTSLAQSGEQAKKVQLVKLSFDDKGYVMTPSTVTKDVPVKMEVDLDTVKGCATTIEFTPTKTGPIEIICGMNMGKGQFTVVEPATK